MMVLQVQMLLAIGPSAVSNAVGSVAFGKDAKANGDFTVALGGGSIAAFLRCSG